MHNRKYFDADRYHGGGCLDHSGAATQRIEALQLAFIRPGLMVTASIGIADSRSRQDTAQIFKRADEALYKAKQSGRNRRVIAAPELPSYGAQPAPVKAVATAV